MRAGFESLQCQRVALLGKVLYLTCFTPPRCNGKLLGDSYNLSAERTCATVAALLKRNDSDNFLMAAGLNLS